MSFSFDPSRLPVVAFAGLFASEAHAGMIGTQVTGTMAVSSPLAGNVFDPLNGGFPTATSTGRRESP